MSVDELTPISGRIITARFWLRHIKILQVYAPTNDADEEYKDSYEQLQKVIDSTLRHDLLLLIGDLNAKVGNKLDGENGIVGTYWVHCERNDNGERFTAFCAINNFAITSTMFPHKDIHLQTWILPNGKHRNQIDHVAINGKFRRYVQDVRVNRGTTYLSQRYDLDCTKLKEVQQHQGAFYLGLQRRVKAARILTRVNPPDPSSR